MILSPGKFWDSKHSESGFWHSETTKKISLYVKQDNSVGKIKAGLVNPRTNVPVRMLYAPCCMCIYMYMYV